MPCVYVSGVHAHVCGSVRRTLRALFILHLIPLRRGLTVLGATLASKLQLSSRLPHAVVPGATGVHGPRSSVPCGFQEF